MKNIFKLSIECVWGVYLREPFLRVVEVPSDMNLGDMHFLMQKLTGFDEDHMATFFSANSFRGEKVWFTKTGELEEGHDAFDGGPLWELRLDEIFPLPKNKKLFYWFDFGDDWTFEIRKMGKDLAPVARAKYPRVIHEEGPKPEQYPDADW